MTTAEMFARLNQLRAARDMKPLKAWKESRAKLEAAIAQLDTSPASHEANVEPAPKAKKATKTQDDTSSIADLARELGIDPKVARAKVRRNEVPETHRPIDKAQRFFMQHKAFFVALLKR